MWSGIPSLTVAGSSEADERAALCALKVLLSEVYPFLEASKCWRFWDGERNTPTGLCSSRAATFCSSFLRDGGQELPEHFFKVRRQLLRAGFPIQDVSAWAFIWCVGVTAGRREATRCWYLNRRWQAGDTRTAFLVWTSLVPMALQWQVTDVSMPHVTWAALGNFFSSLPIELCQCFPRPSAWSGSLLSCALFLSSLSRAGLGRREANEMQAPFGMENRENSVASRPSCGEPLLNFCFQKRKGAFLCVSPYRSSQGDFMK